MTTPKPFIESLKYHDKNRRSAANMRTTVTRMADRTWGTTVLYSRFLMTLTRDETMRLAQQLVNDIDEMDRRNQQPRLPRTITRSYKQQETTSE